MKKIIFLMVFVMLTGISSAQALDCSAGTIITGRDGTTFCKSNVTMNWWSAFNWCSAIGGRLMDMNDCTYGTDYLNSGKCLNLENVGTNWVWTSRAYVSAYAFVVALESGAVSNGYRTNYGYFALCR